MKGVFLASIITLFVLTACGNSGSDQPAGDSMPADNTMVKYKCPIDCEHGKVYDTIGKCPVCMRDMEK